jgi:hypothetical protein
MVFRIKYAPAHEPNSDFGQGPPRLGAMSAQHTPALAHNALKPRAIARRSIKSGLCIESKLLQRPGGRNFYDTCC